MIHPNGGEHRDIRIDEIRGVEASAESDLEHGHLDAARGKHEKRGERVVFEEGERGGGAGGLDTRMRSL